MKKSFVDKFPSLKDEEADDLMEYESGEYYPVNAHYYSQSCIEKNCLDKQRVREVILRALVDLKFKTTAEIKLPPEKRYTYTHIQDAELQIFRELKLRK